MTLLYHGTSIKKWESIQQDGGIDAPSYWTDDLALAQQYALSHGDGVVLVSDTHHHSFECNLQLAQSLYDAGDLDEMPEAHDIALSLREFDSVVCHEVVRHFAVHQIEPESKPISPGM